MMNRLTLISVFLISIPSVLRAQSFAEPIVEKLGIHFADPKAAAISALSNGSLVFSGGWTSGGGELIDQRSNPWFLQLSHERFPQVIHYCIVRSPDYPLPLNVIKPAVSSALSFWREEFFGYYLDEGINKDMNFILGREIFHFDPSCSGDVGVADVDQLPHRLVFQFGYLSSKQEQGLAKIGKDKAGLVAIAVRTGYAAKALQGRGFIYVASGVGNIEVIPNSLNQILIHEVGHVYGLKHSGNEENVMGEAFPHYVMQHGYSSFISPPSVMVSFNKSFKAIKLNDLARKFFSITDERGMNVAYRFSDEKTILLELLLGKREEDEQGINYTFLGSEKIGKIELLKPAKAVNIGTKIDPLKVDGSRLSYSVPEIVEYAASGMFVGDDGQQSSVTVRFSPKGLEIGTMIDDVLYFNIFAQ